MGLANSETGYGSATKAFHWLIVVLFAAQYFTGNLMTSIDWGGAFLGIAKSLYYDWHKSLGLVALFIAIGRIVNRQMGRLPDWAPTLTKREQHAIHRGEQLLYTAMFVMPISGYVYVMAGDYGVKLFGVWELPRQIGKTPWLEATAKWIHIGAGWVLAAVIVAHVGLVLYHQLVKRDRLLNRMLFGRRA